MPTPAVASLQRAGVAGRHASSARMAQRVVVPSRATCRPRVSGAHFTMGVEWPAMAG